MRVLGSLLVSAALLLVTCGGDRSQGAEFRYTLTIAPGNYLFIYGHKFEGDVVCTLEPGDSVRIGGLPVYPRRPAPPRVFSEEEVREAFGEVTFVQDRVREGETWRQASQAHSQRLLEMERSASRVYSRELGRTGSRALAVRAAVDSLDRSLLDPAFEVRVNGSIIEYRAQGLHGWYHLDLGRKAPSPPPIRQPRVATSKKAKEICVGLSDRLGGTGGVWMDVLTDDETILAGEAVARALRQIEEAEKGNPASGPLSSKELNGILAVRRRLTK